MTCGNIFFFSSWKIDKISLFLVCGSQRDNWDFAGLNCQDDEAMKSRK